MPLENLELFKVVNGLKEFFSLVCACTLCDLTIGGNIINEDDTYCEYVLSALKQM